MSVVEVYEASDGKQFLQIRPARVWDSWLQLKKQVGPSTACGEQGEHEGSLLLLIGEHLYKPSAPVEEPPDEEPVCSYCGDTHRVEYYDDERGQPVNRMCTHCPTPCQRCRQGGNGPYCESTPCACACHKARESTTMSEVEVIVGQLLRLNNPNDAWPILKALEGALLVRVLRALNKELGVRLGEERFSTAVEVRYSVIGCVINHLCSVKVRRDRKAERW